MAKTIDRRRLLSRSAVLAPAAGLAALLSADVADADIEGRAHSLIGTWHVDIVFPGPNPPEKGLFLFTNAGLVICTNTRIRDLGLGKWTARASSRFDFTFRHHMFMPDGTWVGTLDIAHSGSVTQNTFSSSGTGTVYDTSGNQTETIESRTTAVRY
ncbi:hypothetical protein E1267_11245 [Nonomuraea longispora]|uniref:Lipocalin-like domain-containing protein n=1 Tax=Nonomuraea longispora TaxID=1848320 RepID=A0A4R4NGN3_9ACTN|nr:hypothetical protein [Nonomuraea longispora]TDC08179.1 hypothetical protein E1267_11245 [Nonomuraea longispora]